MENRLADPGNWAVCGRITRVDGGLGGGRTDHFILHERRKWVRTSIHIVISVGVLTGSQKNRGEQRKSSVD
jgi:hypothetical protein